MKGDKVGYGIVIAIVTLVVFAVYSLWQSTWAVPWAYSGDAIFASIIFQGMTENSWIFDNSRLGMPFGHLFYDFPSADLLHLLVIRCLMWFISDWAIAFNLFFVLTFYFAAWSAYWASRRLGLQESWAIVVAVLFAFLPYHYLRGQGHLFLSGYYAIPPIALYCIWLANGKFICFSRQRHRVVVGIVASLLVALSGIYYAFFACFFLLVAGVAGWVRNRRAATVGVAVLCIVTICLGVALQLAPNYWYYYHEGKNASAGQRSPAGAEIYGLKIIQLFLPVPGHRVELFRHVAEQYINHAPLVNENMTASLGIMGATGCLLSVSNVLLSLSSLGGIRSDLVSSLGRLNLSAILLATIGGGGVVFAVLISPQIRAYNRISVFIAIFSLWTFFLLCQNFILRWRNGRWRKWGMGIAAAIMILGLFDQTPVLPALPTTSTQETFSSDRSFIQDLEKTLPHGAMVFQLPYVSFPESPPVHKMGDYELFRGYLHSKNLRWSYGAMRGRDSDTWQEAVAALPLQEQLQKLTLSGFSGIYIDRNGYDDDGKKIESELRNLLGVEPVPSRNGRLSFFDMRPYATELQKSYGQSEWNRLTHNARYPVTIVWSTGFYGSEKNPQMQWRWASKEAEMILRNYDTGSRNIRMNFSIASGVDSTAHLSIQGGSHIGDYLIDPLGTPVSLNLSLPPGTTKIRFKTDAAAVRAADPRKLYFRVNDFQMTTDSDIRLKEAVQ